MAPPSPLGGEVKRFELSGWVLIALMTLALGVAVWAVARGEIIDLIT